MDIDTTAIYTRYNTGTHFLDSGGKSGRSWQQPLPSYPLTMDFGDDPTISLTHWLSEAADMDHEVQNLLSDIGVENEELSHFEIGAELESHGYTSLARDNVYNTENDFDQAFVWEVWLRPGYEEPSDWVWADKESIVVVVYVHTGADVRGGYAYPLALEFHSDYALALDWCAEWHPDTDDDDTLEWCEEVGLDPDSGEGYCGYSGHPVSHLHSNYLEGWEFDAFDPATSVATYQRNGKTVRIFWSLPSTW